MHTTAAQAKMNKMLISENRGIIFLLGKFIGFQLELGFGIGELEMRDGAGYRAAVAFLEFPEFTN